MITRQADIHQATSRLLATPLHLAAKEGHRVVVELLVELRAQLDAVDHQWRTPLSLACQRGHVEVVRLLATCGADLTLPDEAQATPYDWALQGLSFLSERYEQLGLSSQVGVYMGFGMVLGWFSYGFGMFWHVLVRFSMF